MPAAAAASGQNVLLHCVVEPSGEQSDFAVSWFRGTGELQLLTCEYPTLLLLLLLLGSQPLTSFVRSPTTDESRTIIEDDRFVVRPGLLRDNDWALQIKNLDRSTDSGLYQCQTNQDPPQSQYYQLNVLGKLFPSLVQCARAHTPPPPPPLIGDDPRLTTIRPMFNLLVNSTNRAAGAHFGRA